MMKTFVFRSPLSREECLRRLQEAVNASLRGVRGKVSPEKVSITKQIRYNNLCQPVLNATAKPLSTGTEWVCTIGMPASSTAFIGICWFIGCLLTAGGVDMETILGRGAPFTVFMIAIVSFYKFLSRHEPALLKDFLLTVLEGKEISPTERNFP
ncbi:MAG: hypothetical protein LBV07_01080 [Syntrophobacterales bacterium]|jgi:hypothetical protein|nr:hypothetical protein [Syntrophobacterales bacterium]